jgi:hypothetical protein
MRYAFKQEGINKVKNYYKDLRGERYDSGKIKIRNRRDLKDILDEYKKK